LYAFQQCKNFENLKDSIKLQTIEKWELFETQSVDLASLEMSPSKVRAW